MDLRKQTDTLAAVPDTSAERRETGYLRGNRAAVTSSPIHDKVTVLGCQSVHHLECERRREMFGCWKVLTGC